MAQINLIKTNRLDAVTTVTDKIGVFIDESGILCGIDENGDVTELGELTNPIVDSNDKTSIDFENRTLHNMAGRRLIDYDAASLYDGDNINSIDWHNRVLYDGNGNIILDYANGEIFNVDGDKVFDTKVKRYKAIISQTGTNAPVVDAVLEDTIGGDFVWSYVGEGIYNLTNTGKFTNNKTFCQVSITDDDGYANATVVKITPSLNVIQLVNYKEYDTRINDAWYKLFLLIEVYP